MSDSVPYISQVNCVASFKLDVEVRYKVKEIEKAFHGVVASEAKATNVGDTMPAPLPRFTMQSGPKQLSISQVSGELALNFEKDKKVLEETFSIAYKNASEFWDGICKLKTPSERIQFGVVIAINCPSELPTEGMGKIIYDRYIKIPALGEVASSLVQVGFQHPKFDVFRNVSVSGYELHSGVIDNKAMTHGGFDMNSLPLTESGFGVKLDVNTRPMAMKGLEITDAVGKLVLDQLKELVFGEGKQFLNW